MSEERAIEYRPVAELKPHPRNPKDHDLHTLNASVNRFGYIDPIVIDERTGYIISGHGRAEALQGMEKGGNDAPDGVQIDDSGKWLVPVSVGWASKNDAEAVAALIALNKTSELGGWVDEVLTESLMELSEAGDLFDGVGFDETYLENMSSYFNESKNLDDLADAWDGSGMKTKDEPEPAKEETPDSTPANHDAPSAGNFIRISDEAVWEAWQAHKSDYASDDDALEVLLAGE